MEPTQSSKWLATPVIVSVVIILIGVIIGSSYNGFVTLNEVADTQWAQVESQYQRRFDLIPNLVASVQGVMKQETAIFTALADARTRYSGATNSEQKAAAASQVEGTFGRLLAVMENYPQLKSADTVQSLMAEIAGTENRIAVERMRFNEAVLAYNLKVKTFPGSMFAGVFGFTARSTFESKEGSDVPPVVKF
jgi:LemA protein